jgi:putative CocE/NonD family hydrolase
MSLLDTFLSRFHTPKVRGPSDRDPHGRHRVPPLRYHKTTTRSQYLTMRDGVRIAIDVTLPNDLPPGQKIPAILTQTRYFRSVAYRRWYRALGLDQKLDDLPRTRAYFVGHGYAWVDVCARGSGASGGQRPCPWHEEEVRDGAEVVDWILAQPWSSGAVGATGVSYAGTSADMLMINQHPAVKAVIPRFSLFDAYADTGFIGGVYQSGFVKLWGEFNAALDRNDYGEAFAMFIRHNLRALWQYQRDRGPAWSVRPAHLLAGPQVERLVAAFMNQASDGVSPTDADTNGTLVAAAVREHKNNYDVHAGALRTTYRDDIGLVDQYPDRTIDTFSPHHYLDQIQGSKTAIYSYSGWYDSAYQRAAIKRFCSMPTPGSKLILGPWDHGGNQNASPHSSLHWTEFDHFAEMLRFFDCHLKGIDNGCASEPPVRYFTMGEERWKETDAWPPAPARVLRLHLSAGGTLARQPRASRVGEDTYCGQSDTTSGHRSRWCSLLGLMVPVGYADERTENTKRAVYRSTPLAEDTEVTGHPLVHLSIRPSSTDLQLFVYLQDMAPDGSITTVTEGCLRALHRRVSQSKPPHWQPGPYHSFEKADGRPMELNQATRLSFDLLPVSYLFRRGHSVALALALADRENFSLQPGPPPIIRILCGGKRGSVLELPVMGGEIS